MSNSKISSNFLTSSEVKDKYTGTKKPSDDPNNFYPLYDEVFEKRMKDPDICPEFLKAVLGKPVKITSIKTQSLMSETVEGTRRAVLDIVAEEGDIHIYNIEAQRKFIESHRKRCVFIGCRLMSMLGLDVGSDYKDTKPVTVIFINLKNSNGREYLDDICLRYSEPPHDEYSGDFRIIELNLDKLAKLMNDKSNKAVGNNLKFFFLAFSYNPYMKEFKEMYTKLNLNYPNLVEKLKQIFGLMFRDEKISQAVNTYIANNDIPERELSVMEKDIYLEKGRVEGRVEGAISGIRDNIPLDIVGRLTGLERSFLEELANNPQISLESALDLYYSKY